MSALMFFVFGAAGVHALYAAPEREASFGLATRAFCPAAVRRLLERYELAPRFRAAQPRARQIGGVARAARPCFVAYTARGA